MIKLTVEQTEVFYKYLTGEEMPETVHIKHPPNLSEKKAFQVIWFLQEHFRLIPDTYEQCWQCKKLFDTNYEGLYWETKYRHYCGNCSDIVPYNYDRGKK